MIRITIRLIFFNISLLLWKKRELPADLDHMDTITTYVCDTS